MKAFVFVLGSIFALSLSASVSGAAQKEARFFEMRTYYAAPGKLDDLLARFRDHTTKLFETIASHRP